MHHVTTGLKIKDLRAKDQVFSTILLYNGKFPQSKNLYYPLKVFIYAESEVMYGKFCNMFEYFDSTNLFASTEANMFAT